MPKAKKTPSGKWRVRVYSHTNENGVKVYRSFTADSKKEAEYMAASYKTQKLMSASSMTVGEAISRYIESKTNVLSPTTIHGYKKIQKNHMTDLQKIPLSDLTREAIQKCVNNEARTSSAKTISNVYGLLRAAVTMQEPEFVFNIRLPRRVRPLRRDLPTSETVFNAVRGTPVELPVLLALWLCLRLSEVRGVKKTAIHGDTLYIERVIVTVGREHVEKELAKTDSSRRIVRLPPRLKKMILSQEGDYATELTGKAIYSRFTRLMEKHGYPNIRFHDLRHISASDMNRLGITDRVAADRGGWSTTSTMRSVYQHSFSTDRENAEQIINDFYSSLLENKGDDKSK